MGKSLDFLLAGETAGRDRVSNSLVSCNFLVPLSLVSRCGTRGMLLALLCEDLFTSIVHV